MTPGRVREGGYGREIRVWRRLRTAVSLLIIDVTKKINKVIELYLLQ